MHADNSTKAHEMVETPMLSANQAFATFAAENGIPIIYRVEDFIEEEKIEQITAFLEKMQIPFDFDGHYESFGSLQIAINKAVARANAKNGELFAQVVSEQLIKCLPRARYDVDNCGHFALSFEEYAHTTSPIRRFADLINQMQILAFKSGKPLPFKDEELREICSHINYTERNSAELEMQTDELLNAWFVKQRLDAGEDLTEKGYISRVARDRITIATSFGSAIVELADSAYDSPFRLSEDMLSIKNSVTKKEYHVGQPLEVKPTKVDIDSCAINAEIIFEKGSAERNSQYADEIRNFYGGGRNV